MGLKASSFYTCMLGTDADKPFADTLRSLCLDLQGLQFRLSPLTRMLQLSTLLFFKIPKDGCVVFIKASSVFWIAKGDWLFSYLFGRESSFLLRMTCLFLRQICLRMTKQLWMLLIQSSLLLRCWTGLQLIVKGVLKASMFVFQILLIIINISRMNASQSRRKEESSIKKLQNSKEIDVLYHEFQSLKSQIYGVKRQSKSKPIDAQWTNKTNKEKAVGMLRESTIHKCQQELQQNLTMIQSSQPKLKKNLFKANNYMQSESDDYVTQLKESYPNNKNFSKKLKEYSEEPSIYLQESAGHSLKPETLHFAEGQEIFRQFLSSSHGRLNAPQLSASRRQQNSQLISLVQSLIEEIAEDHLKKLNFLLETLTFMSRKLHCLELIIQQYGKVLRAKNQHEASEKAQQTQLIISVDALEKKYEAQMKKLAQYYQAELKKQTTRFTQNQMKVSASLKTDESNAMDQLKEENQRLSDLLRQAKDLISTKEQFITSLAEENQQLKDQIQKWKRPNLIRGSADSSLGYSVTAQKHPKKELSHEMGHIVQRLNMAIVSGQKRDWDEFEEGSNGDINYSELESVKDRSIDDWDISHLNLRQNSNAKSLEEDCLKVMGGRQGRNDDEAF